MKKLVLMLAVAATFGLAGSANAQVGFSLNIGSQPAWGPSGYDYARYYYIPDIDAYYDVANSSYVYNSNGNWISARSLPATFRFDPYNSYKVVINDPTPWRYHDRYRSQYATYRGRHDQPTLYGTDPRFRDKSWGGYNRGYYLNDQYRRGRTWDEDDHFYRNDHDHGKHEGWEKHKDRD
jgi:hypothetical protein